MGHQDNCHGLPAFAATPQVKVIFTCPSTIIFLTGFFSSLISSTTQSPHGREQPFKNKAGSITPFLRLPLGLGVKSSSLPLSTSPVLLLSPCAQATLSFFLFLDCTKISLRAPTLAVAPGVLPLDLRAPSLSITQEFRANLSLSTQPNRFVSHPFVLLY